MRHIKWLTRPMDEETYDLMSTGISARLKSAPVSGGVTRSDGETDARNPVGEKAPKRRKFPGFHEFSHKIRNSTIDSNVD
jgi:hypothetical protein